MERLGQEEIKRARLDEWGIETTEKTTVTTATEVTTEMTAVTMATATDVTMATEVAMAMEVTTAMATMVDRTIKISSSRCIRSGNAAKRQGLTTACSQTQIKFTTTMTTYC